ncbi:MAG: VWD domain-containing protein, partial [Microcoleus sp.]
NLDLASFLAGKVDFNLFGGTVSANSPKITSLSPGNPPPANGQLPAIAATGKSDNVLNFGLDLDKVILSKIPLYRILQTAAKPTGLNLEGLGFDFKYPNAGEAEGKAQKSQATADRAQADLQRQLDLLKIIPAEGQASALREAERLRQISEAASKEAAEAKKQVEQADTNANKERNRIAVNGDILDIQANGGFALQQDFSFIPEKINVTVSTDKGLVDGAKQSQVKSIADSFELTAPPDGCGVMKVKVKYELVGEVKNDIGLVLQGSIDAKALEVGGSVTLGGRKLFENSFGPAFSGQLPEGGLASPPFTLVGSDPDPIPFLSNDPTLDSRKIKTIKTSEIGGTEQDDNSQSGGTKNLIIEKEYEIPYNLPVSVADANVTEGNSGTKDMVFPVTLRDPAKEAITLSYNSPKGSGTVTIAAGQTRGEIKIPVIGDIIPEPDEAFTLTVTDRDGKFAADCPIKDPFEATGIIIDDDRKPDPPNNGGKTYNDPRIVTVDKQYHDFQAAGEFTLIESTTGDLKIQVRQQPIDNNPRSNVSDNTAVATILAGKRIGIYKDRGLLIDGQQIQMASNDALAIGDGRIYREGNTYTIVYPTGDQLVANNAGSRINVNVFLTEERQGKVKGLLGNFNNNPKDDLAKPDGTVIPEPVSQRQLYGEYADSWRINQTASLFDYKPGENTNSFTLKNYPRQKVTIADLNPADIQRAEQLIGDRIKNPITREAAIIDLILTNFDPDIIQAAIDAPDPVSTLAFASVLTANNDFSATTVNTATTIDVLANDITAKDPLSIKEFNPKSVAGGIISLDNNKTPDDKSDDLLAYTPPPNFTGDDKFNYLLTDGKQIQVATVTININSLKLTNLSGNNGFVLNGTEAGNFSGFAVSKTGDINGDKIDDIIVGSFGADPNNVNAAGKSQVIFGDRKFPASVNLSQLNGQNGFTLNGTDTEGFSGRSVSDAGDINGDGIKDFIIGAFAAPVGGQNNVGKTYIVFGTNKGFPANFNLANLNGNNGFAVTGTNTFDYAGLFATGISDINGDRIDDILISAPGPLGGTPGKSYVIYGRTTGFSPNINLAQINGNSGFVINGIDGNSSGTASSGDINGDGIPDLVIGADGGTTSGGVNAGKTYVIFGQQGAFFGSVNVPELNGTTGFVIAGLGTEERSGISLTATGDLNGDGYKDLVIGAPDASAGDRINAGKTYIVFGKASAFPAIVNPAELNGSNGLTIYGFDVEGSAGNAVSYAGDLNKDGFDDLLIGTPGANSDSKNNAGKTFVVFGKKEFPANFSLAETNGKNALVLNGGEADALVGNAVSGAGDINGDGIDDLVVGAPGTLFQDYPGKSYAIFGSRGFGFDNPNNGLQGTDRDDIINGTDGDDSISGIQGNDKIFGNSGQDLLSGNLNDDYLDGAKGQDNLIGGDGNDSLVGGLGNDALQGDNDNDILTGVDINAINPGIDEIDTLIGGGGSDIFVLGDATKTYYDNGDRDYAMIADFNASEDSIQLQGKAADYAIVPFSQGNQSATAIYRKNPAQNELIGIIQGGANLSLSGSYFRFI